MKALASLPPELADRLRAHAASMTEMAAAQIHEDVPEYLRPGNPAYLASTRAAVRDALDAFLDRVGTDAPPPPGLRERFRRVGAGEAREGRSLDSLQTAMRTAVVTIWRRITAEHEGQPPLVDARHAGPAAEALFLFLEEMASAATEGYDRARAEVSGELERRRWRLTHLLLSEPEMSRPMAADLAAAADWRLPDSVAVAVLAGPQRPGLPPQLPGDALHDFQRAEPCIIVPDPDRPRRRLLIERALQGRTAVIGPTVDVTRTPVSLARAGEGLRLIESGAVPAQGVVAWSDLLAPLLLLRNEALLGEMIRTRLAPLAPLRPAQRERLAETLLHWLQNGFNAARVAELLHVHPQTVRYRLRQLHDLFGDALDDPDRRFETEAALRAERLASRAAPGTDESALAPPAE
ncbi:helix-turn-helix domain-containing protein [Nocardiopsis coralliicola]